MGILLITQSLEHVQPPGFTVPLARRFGRLLGCVCWAGVQAGVPGWYWAGPVWPNEVVKAGTQRWGLEMVVVVVHK